jgi:hypothetical protein
MYTHDMLSASEMCISENRILCILNCIKLVLNWQPCILILKFMYSSKNVSEVYLVKYCRAKTAWPFGQFISQKVWETAHWFGVFIHSEQHGGIFDSFDSLHQGLLPGTPFRQ